MRLEQRPAGNPARRRTLIFTGGVVAVLLILVAAASSLYTEVLWFDEIGFTEVFWTGVWTRLALGAVFGVVFAAVLLVNLWIVRKITNPARLFTVSDQVLERYRASLLPYTRWVVIGGSLLFGLFAGSGASVQWRDWLLFRNAVDFGTTDPVFNLDLGFYVFRLPFHQFLFTWGFSTLVVATLVTAGAHYFMGGIRPQGPGDRVAPEVRAHLSVLFGLIVLLKAWGYRLDQFNLLYSERGVVTGASYTDVNAQLPALRLLVIIAIVCSVLFFVNAKLKNWILPLGGIGLLALTSILAGGVYPAIVQRLRVAPDEQARERPYIEENLGATRLAYGIAEVDARPFAARGTLSAADIAANRETIQNIRLWDPSILQDQYLNLQRIRPYYEFADIDVDRYTFDDGSRRQVMLGPRELDPTGLRALNADTWLNRHLVYTHGYGVVANRVDRVIGDGQPEFVAKNIPPVATQESLQLEGDGGQLYFGEIDEPSFVIANSGTPELDYPEGDGFETTTYDGTGGIQMTGVFRRAAFAWRFRDINLLISGSITPESRLLFRRDVRERLRRAAPFLRFDDDPYVAIVDGRLVWIADAYTVSDNYPYSQQIDFGAASDNFVRGEGNYIRNSAKFTIDAKDGTITGYVWDEDDPILSAWLKIFPGLLEPKAAMPEGIVEHVRYPEGLFQIQTEVFSAYHIQSPDNFYSREDLWQVARDPGGEGLDVPPIQPYYVLQKLPGEEELDFVLVRPFTATGRGNMTAMMVAHGDPDTYGRLVVYEFPKSEAIRGPSLVHARINQDPTFSERRTLLGTEGSDFKPGNLLVVPIEDSLLYVEPWYLEGTEGTGTEQPELKFVVVLSGEKIAFAPTLGEALRNLVSGEVTTPVEPGQEQTREELLSEAQEHFEAADRALQAGDLEEFARQYRLGRRAMDEALEGESQPQQGDETGPAAG